MSKKVRRVHVYASTNIYMAEFYFTLQNFDVNRIWMRDRLISNFFLYDFTYLKTGLNTLIHLCYSHEGENRIFSHSHEQTFAKMQSECDNITTYNGLK